MSFKSIVRELKEMRDGFSSSSRRGNGGGGASQCSWPHSLRYRNQGEEEEAYEQGSWANLPPELLLDVMQRVEASEVAWPARRNVVSCSSVCRSWRETTKEVVQTPEKCGRITFPISLKQPGPRDGPMQCFIWRDRGTSTYRLYLGLSPSIQGENDKLLLASRRIRRATSTEFVISLSRDDFSRGSSTYIGKLKSNFLGTKFTVYDSQPPQDAPIVPNNHSSRRLHSRQVSPRVPAGNYNIATIAYELNILRTRGPRRMRCTVHSIPISSIQEGGIAPTPTSFIHSLDQLSTSERKDLIVEGTSLNSKGKDPIVEFSSTSLSEPLKPVQVSGEPLVLKNKAPRWHEQLQCWCLNFRGRVTVASVKNFQLVVAVDESHQVPIAEQEKAILQFGKIGKDIFTMDYLLNFIDSKSSTEIQEATRRILANSTCSSSQYRRRSTGRSTGYWVTDSGGHPSQKTTHLWGRPARSGRPILSRPAGRSLPVRKDRGPPGPTVSTTDRVLVRFLD